MDSVAFAISGPCSAQTWYAVGASGTRINAGFLADPRGRGEEVTSLTPGTGRNA